MITGGLFSEIRLDYYKILGLQTYDTFNKHAEQRWPVITACFRRRLASIVAVNIMPASTRQNSCASRYRYFIPGHFCAD